MTEVGFNTYTIEGDIDRKLHKTLNKINIHAFDDVAIGVHNPIGRVVHGNIHWLLVQVIHEEVNGE